jgi:hypothetical protein
VDAPRANKPRSDVYVGLLILSLLAQIAAGAFLFLDYSQYPESKPPKITDRPKSAGGPAPGVPPGPPPGPVNPPGPPAGGMGGMGGMMGGNPPGKAPPMGMMGGNPPGGMMMGKAPGMP